MLQRLGFRRRKAPRSNKPETQSAASNDAKSSSPNLSRPTPKEKEEQQEEQQPVVVSDEASVTDIQPTGDETPEAKERDSSVSEEVPIGGTMVLQQERRADSGTLVCDDDNDAAAETAPTSELPGTLVFAAPAAPPAAAPAVADMDATLKKPAAAAAHAGKPPLPPSSSSAKFRESTQLADPAEQYELLDVLGEGSYGSVHKARHRSSGQLCAIKIVPTESESAEELRKEIDYLKRGKSPFVVGYHGSFQQQRSGDIWIVMDLCEAGSVSDLMRATRRTLTEPQLRAVAACMLLGLRQLHGLRMIHRDVKGGNVLLTAGGLAKLADFGVSKQLNTKQTKADTAIGTPFWMAPEVISEGRYAFSADVWSLGITLLELAEGEPPFTNLHPMRALFVIPKKPPATFREPQRWSQQLNDFLASCLVKDPAARPSSADLVAHPWLAQDVAEIEHALESGEWEACKPVAILRELVTQSMPVIEELRADEAAADADAAAAAAGGTLALGADGTVKRTMKAAKPAGAPTGTLVSDSTARSAATAAEAATLKVSSGDFMQYFQGTGGAASASAAGEGEAAGAGAAQNGTLFYTASTHALESAVDSEDMDIGATVKLSPADVAAARQTHGNGRDATLPRGAFAARNKTKQGGAAARKDRKDMTGKATLKAGDLAALKKEQEGDFMRFFQ